MNTLPGVAAMVVIGLWLAIVPAAHAGTFGLNHFDVTFTGEPADLEDATSPDGPILTQAGEHPFAMNTSFLVNSEATGEGGQEPFEPIRDALFTQMDGFAASPTAVPTCSTADFLTIREEKGSGGGSLNVSSCPDSAAVGYITVQLSNRTAENFAYGAVYNLQSAPGIAGRLGFWVGGIPVTIDARLTETPPYRIVAGPTNTPQLVEVVATKFTLWGVPADERHDPLRGRCLGDHGESRGACHLSIGETPFITMSRSCGGPLATEYDALSWRGSTEHGAVLTHDEFGNPQGMSGCGQLAFGPAIASKPTTRAATSPSGLDFSLDVNDEGLTNPVGIAGSDIEKTVVTLPKGLTINPAQAEGLEVCSEAQLAAESPFSAPGEGPTYTPPGAGCPEASKIGTIEVETPLLEDKLLKGALYVAEPYHNLAGDSLIAVYVVIKDPSLGIVVKQPLRVQPDPVTGQLVTTATDLPQLPFSHFRLHFREGGRAPLISPPGCGTFDTTAVLYPWSGNPPITASSSFQIVSGPNGSPCPAGPAPFHPGFAAGTLNNAAAKYSPFYMHITRGDGEQDLTKFSSILPPGVVGKIAGVPYCPESGIAQAMSRTGEHGGTAELSDPSCPAPSQIGATTAGAGVGSQLTYVGGKLYLAGSYHGDPLSVVSITPAVAGPFDAGTVVVRIALTLNPVTGEVEADGSASDPIPHILQGIPLNVRDLGVRVDRPEFTLNATSCDEERARAKLFGGGTVLAPAPDTPVDLSARYQAASCASLGFRPRLAIRLRGGTRRGAHPALRAVVRPRPFKDANFSRAVVTLPHSAFLDQGHIRTICTRVQFAAGAGNGERCPKGAVYGHAKAWTPLLDEPLSGPVFLRSSSHNLPDLVVALHGIVDIDLDARIDSVHGGIRSTFTGIPDAPVSRFVLAMQGAKKGLIINSRNLCFKPKRNRAKANLTGQNGRRSRGRPVVRALKCRKSNRKRHRGHRKRRHGAGRHRGHKH